MYISLLKKIYKDQKAPVQTDGESNMFEIKKRTKQGDRLSSLLFDAVPHHSLKEVAGRWQKKKGVGIYVSDRDHDCLTNLRFADEVVLFATSEGRFQKMMYEFKELKKWGSGSTHERRKFLASKAAKVRTRKKKCKSAMLKLKS